MSLQVMQTGRTACLKVGMVGERLAVPRVDTMEVTRNGRPRNAVTLPTHESVPRGNETGTQLDLTACHAPPKRGDSGPAGPIFCLAETANSLRSDRPCRARMKSCPGAGQGLFHRGSAGHVERCHPAAVCRMGIGAAPNE